LPGFARNSAGILFFKSALPLRLSSRPRHEKGRGMKDLPKTARQKIEKRANQTRAWRESTNVCALADSERHLGHAICVGHLWIAYDALHMNRSDDGFRIIGTFTSVDAAKKAVEQSVEIGWALEVTGIEKVEESRQHALLRSATTSSRAFLRNK